MNRGPNVSRTLPALARDRGFTQAKLEQATGIVHSTMSRYWSGRGGLGLRNGRKIADALGVEISDLGLSEEGAAVDDRAEILRTLAALEETIAAMKTAQTRLVRKVTALERALGELEPRRAATQHDQPTRSRKAASR